MKFKKGDLIRFYSGGGKVEYGIVLNFDSKVKGHYIFFFKPNKYIDCIDIKYMGRSARPLDGAYIARRASGKV